MQVCEKDWNRDVFSRQSVSFPSIQSQAVIPAREFCQPMRARIELAHVLHSFFDSFESAPKVFKQTKFCLGRAICHLAVEGRGSGVKRSPLSLSLPSASCVLNTDKTHFECVILTLICGGFILYLSKSSQWS